jgi:hypothetical protein
MPISILNNTITGLGVGGLPSGTVNSSTLADSSVTSIKMGYNGGVVQTTYTYFDGTDYANQSYVNIASITIAPIYSNSMINLWCSVPVAFQPGHAGEGRWLRNGTNWLEGNPSSSNRYQGYGGEEGVSSDGGASFGLNAIDFPNTTSSTQYVLQLAHESGSNAGVGRSRIGNNDQNSPGYPGIYRTYVIAQEIRRGF